MSTLRGDSTDSGHRRARFAADAREDPRFTSVSPTARASHEPRATDAARLRPRREPPARAEPDSRRRRVVTRYSRSTSPGAPRVIRRSAGPHAVTRRHLEFTTTSVLSPSAAIFGRSDAGWTDNDEPTARNTSLSRARRWASFTPRRIRVRGRTHGPVDAAAVTVSASRCYRRPVRIPLPRPGGDRSHHRPRADGFRAVRRPGPSRRRRAARRCSA